MAKENMYLRRDEIHKVLSQFGKVSRRNKKQYEDRYTEFHVDTKGWNIGDCGHPKIEFTVWDEPGAGNSMEIFGNRITQEFNVALNTWEKFEKIIPLIKKQILLYKEFTDSLRD